MKADVCTEQELGTVLYDKTAPSTIQVASFNFTEEEDKGIRFMDYFVSKTGYYCAMTWPLEVNGVDSEYSGVVEFKNKFGQLAGSDFPKLPVRTDLGVSIGVADKLLKRLLIRPFLCFRVVLRRLISGLYSRRHRLDGFVRQTLARDPHCSAFHLWSDLVFDDRDGLQLGVLGRL